MKRIGVCICLMILISTSGRASQYDATVPLEVLSKRVKKTPLLEPNQTYIGSIPAPDGAPRGLAFDGTYLWVANTGDGNSQFGRKIYKLDASTGAILGAYQTPGNDFPYGLAWDGNHLWHGDFGTDMIYKVDTTTMTPVRSFQAPNDFLFDLAWDGTFLYGACGLDAFILKIDTIDGSVVDTIECTYTSPNVRPLGLSYLPFAAGQIWTCDGNYGSNYVSEWDFDSTAWVYQWDASPASYPDGLAYDPLTGYLWVACWNSDSIYIFDVGTGIEESEHTLPNEHISFEIIPNPISSFIRIDLFLPERSSVEIGIYDIAGRIVAPVIDGMRERGSHTTRWNAKRLSSGIYFVRIEAGDFVGVRKISVHK